MNANHQSVNMDGFSIHHMQTYHSDPSFDHIIKNPLAGVDTGFQSWGFPDTNCQGQSPVGVGCEIFKIEVLGNGLFSMPHCFNLGGSGEQLPGF